VRGLPALALVVLAACGPGRNRLSGSIAADATLTFEEVRVEWIVDQLSIQYVSTGAVLSKEAARLTVPGALAVSGREIAIERQVLVEHFYAQGDQAGRRVEEPPFPAVAEGTLTFTQAGKKPGSRVAGNFKVVFKGEGDTLVGEFDTEVVAVR